MKTHTLLFYLLVSSLAGFCQSNSSKLWTEAEREVLLKGLERTKNEVSNEIKGLSEQQWNFKEDSTRWSIAEIVEHLITQDESFTK
jgi:hypothetical protein